MALNESTRLAESTNGTASTGPGNLISRPFGETTSPSRNPSISLENLPLGRAR